MEYPVQASAIPDIALYKGRRGTANFPQALQRDQAAIAQIVEYDYLVTGLHQRDTRMAANVACASCHQYGTGHSVYLT
jgi:hypothetical protein